MSGFCWYEAHPPRDLDLAAVTRLLRTLVNRAPRGLMQASPAVAFETWSYGGTVRWLIGVDRAIRGNLVWQLCSQMEGLKLVRCAEAPRSALMLAGDLRLSTVSFPLRLDTAEAVSAGLLAALAEVRSDEVAVLQWVIGPSSRRAKRPADFTIGSALGLSAPAKPSAQDQQQWRDKVREPLFGVCCRAGAYASEPSRAENVVRSVVDALRLAESPRSHFVLSRPATWRARSLAVVHRPGAVWGSVMNAAELAAVLGWPLGDIGIPGRAVALPPAPRPLLAADDDGRIPRGIRVLGRGLHPADSGQLVTVPPDTVSKNLHVTGPTGSGKSNLLAQLVLADAVAGHTVLCIEPRGDLVADVLARLPEKRHDDVVVIEPGDGDQVGFNPLAGPADEAERRADELVGLLREVFGSAIGPRSADVLLHALITAARLSDGTLADVPVLLANSAFRRRTLTKVGDPLTLGPWWAWFDSLSEGERQQVVAPVMNKLRAFLSRQAIRRMLGQPAPAFTLDEAFSARPKIVLVNLNRGVIGPEAARLLGGLLLSAAWAAMQRRASLSRAKRFKVSWVIDEFQEYVGALDFGDVLAQSRGLGGTITIAHQHLGQLSPVLRAATTANARSRLSFRPSQDDAKPLAAMFGQPVTADDLLTLGAYQACARLLVNGEMGTPFGLQTLPLELATTDPSVLRQRSRDRYATDGDALDEQLRRRWHGEDEPRDVPIGTRRRRAS